jgi:rRNA maturation RNase YbeY
MAASGRFSIASTVRSHPRLPSVTELERMKDDILGRSYALSLAFVGARRAQAINRKNRKKTSVPNVLSFPLAKDHGEVLITPNVARKEARERGMTPGGYIGFLFIHALLHLKGMRHGDTMDMLEKRYCKKYHLA